MLPQLTDNVFGSPVGLIETDKAVYEAGENIRFTITHNYTSSSTILQSQGAILKIGVPQLYVYHDIAAKLEGQTGPNNFPYNGTNEIILRIPSLQNPNFIIARTTFEIDCSNPQAICISEIRIQTDKSYYNDIETIIISGEFRGYNVPDGDNVEITFQQTDDTHIISSVFVPVNNNEFTLNLLTDNESWEFYRDEVKITASYGNMSSSTNINYYSSYPSALSLESLHNQDMIINSTLHDRSDTIESSMYNIQTYYLNVTQSLQSQVDSLIILIEELQQDEESSIHCGEPKDHYNDLLHEGTNGDDIIYGTDGPDLINGGNGNDTIYGGDGDDCIRGGNGNDTIYGEGGDDNIHGDHGNDLMYGGPGYDIGEGHKGIDTCIDFEITENCEIFIDPNSQPTPEEPLYCDQPKSFYNEINGTAGNDRISGTEGPDLIYSFEGDDFVNAKGGDNCVFLGPGSDVGLVWGNGTNFIDAGPGNWDKIQGGINSTDTCINANYTFLCDFFN